VVFSSGVTAHASDVILPVRMTFASGAMGSRHRVGGLSAAVGEAEPQRGGASSAASINRTANGAPLAGGRFVCATAHEWNVLKQGNRW
jgi:hypothetical protein